MTYILFIHHLQVDVVQLHTSKTIMPQLMEIDAKYNKICSALQAEDKSRRKKALEEILNDVLGSVESLDEQSLSELWEIFHRPTVRMLRDQAEACRDLSLEVLKKFLMHLPCSDKNIVYIIPIMTKNLGAQELLEQSEEVRLKCIILLKAIVEKYQDQLLNYFDDLTTILTRRVMDKYPKVKKESCECICEVAKAMPKNFHENTHKFIKPILSNMSHQHYKIRVTTIQTVGEVLLIGNCKSVEDVATPMAERLFDQSGAVRTAVVEVAGRLLTAMRDRYSYWHKLVPLLLTGMNDVLPEIRERSTQLWMTVGEQYIDENTTDQKFNDKMNTLPEFLSHYPPNITRPNLGCRTIIQSNASKLLPAISRELHDWMADIKVRAAQLLCIIILNIEEEMIMHMPKIFPSMFRACNDEDKRMVENVELAAEYLGYFVPPTVYCELLWPTLEQNPTTGHLKVFSAVLRGSPRELLVPELPKIGELLRKDYICQSKKIRYQMEILNCCGSLLNVCKENCTEIGMDLFTAAFTTLALSTEHAVEKKALDTLEQLTQAEGLGNLNELYIKHIEPVLMSVQGSPGEWSMNSSELHIFHACITYAKAASYRHLDLIHPIFEKTTKEDSDKKIQLKQFMMLSDYFINWDEPVEKDSTSLFIDFTNTILEKVIIPGLDWTAGRSAEAIRTASVCCLCAILNKFVENCESDGVNKQKKFVISIENFGWLFEQVRPTLVKLLDDDAHKTRLYCLQAICLIMNIGQELHYINEDNIHKTSVEVMGRLEDQHDDVRLAALEAIREVWKVVPKDYELDFYYVHIEYVYKHTLLHLDDPGEKFQRHAFDCLMDLVKVHPAKLIKTIESMRAKFINQKALDQLEKAARDHLKGQKSKGKKSDKLTIEEIKSEDEI